MSDKLSEESRARRRRTQELVSIGARLDSKISHSAGTGAAHQNQVLGEFKATLKDDNANEQTKTRARKALDASNSGTEPLPQSKSKQE
ncbi:hypothetical protein GYMLUDRAFT_238432 [Collybiopsis luxurians FD-317 M1]|nr:hypothetical protein GYMLUDRAFT_238432 [Collybiopsis luxurians FD-317 M1]